MNRKVVICELVVALVALAACAQPAAGAPLPADVGDVVLGEMHVTRVVDGDTIWVDGLDASLRLLGIDTEETFKTDADRRGYAAGWAAYAAGKRAAGARPAKYATPLGEDAKVFAKQFFAGVERVRVERDDPAEIRDRYGRYLAYVLARTGGAWVNYNVECVRAGMAPYFTKYGRSRRYDADFVAAEAEAKAAHRGIWAPGAQGYPDYPEREAWWTARGEFVGKFRAAASGDARYIDVSHEDAPSALAARVGSEVVILGTVGDVFEGDRGPVRVMLARTGTEDLPIVIFDRDVFRQTGLAHRKGEYVTVTGTPSVYAGRGAGRRAGRGAGRGHGRGTRNQVEIVIDKADQVVLSPLPALAAP